MADDKPIYEFDGYAQFWVLGPDPLNEGEQCPVPRTIYQSRRDADGVILHSPPRRVFLKGHTLDEKVELAREMCLAGKMLGFSICASDGTELRPLELCNLWEEGLLTNDRH